RGAVAAGGRRDAGWGGGGWRAVWGGGAPGLTGALGPLVTVTGGGVEGLRAPRRSVAERSMGRLAGQPYQQETALAARDRLAQLGAFRSVTVEGLEGDGDWSRAQLVYRVE